MSVTHPTIALLIAWVIVLAFDACRRSWHGRQWQLPRGVLLAASVTTVSVFCLIVVWYASQPTYFDPAESTITAVAAVFGAGKPLYPALDAPERYAHVYGPALFVAHASAMALFGQSILVSKAVGALAVLTSLVLSYRVFVKQSDRSAALVATSMCALVYLGFGNAAFWTRADPLLILSVGLGLYAARGRGRIGALVILGMATGLAVNLKASGPAYLVPAFVVVGFKHGRWTLASASTLAFLVALAPFLLPNVSMRHYVEYLELSARNGLVLSKLRQNLEWSIFLFAPVLALAYGERVSGSVKAFVIALGATLAAISLIAAKPGGGPYHLAPCVPILAYAALQMADVRWRRTARQSLVAAFCLTALVIAIPKQATLIGTIINRRLEPAIDDLRRFAGAHAASRVAVGYAGTSRFSDARPEIVFLTKDYWLDAPAIQEHRLSGLSLPASTMRAIDECRDEYWLVPIGSEAFSVPSAYWPDGPKDVFPDDFRQAFFRRYRRTEQTLYFDVWKCQLSSTSQPGASRFPQVPRHDNR